MPSNHFIIKYLFSLFRNIGCQKMDYYIDQKETINHEVNNGNRCFLLKGFRQFHTAGSKEILKGIYMQFQIARIMTKRSHRTLLVDVHRIICLAKDKSIPIRISDLKSLFCCFFFAFISLFGSSSSF
jgi:hypothetical protein